MLLAKFAMCARYLIKLRFLLAKHELSPVVQFEFVSGVLAFVATKIAHFGFAVEERWSLIDRHALVNADAYI